MSTVQNPIYGGRYEFDKKRNSHLDSTALLVARIEAIEKVFKTQVIVGYAYFPIFIDLDTDSPAKKNCKKFGLNDGYFQLPIFAQKPSFEKPIYFDNISKSNRIPCATLEIRIEVAKKDSKGKPISLSTASEEIKNKENIVKAPPRYTEGLYNNQYIELFKEEMKIFNEKAKRRDIPCKSAVEYILSKNKGDKKFSSRLAKASKKKFENLTEDDIANFIFEKNETLIYYTIEIQHDYIQHYVPNNPPGLLYSEVKLAKKTVIFNEIDFDSYIRAQKFDNLNYSLTNPIVSSSSAIIIDIQSYKPLKDGKFEMNHYGWTVLPIFDTLLSEDGSKRQEFYFKSGIFMMPIIKGPVREEMVTKMQTEPNVWDYIQSEATKKVPSIKFFDQAAVAVRCLDSQRLHQFNEILYWKNINYDYCLDNKNQYIYDNKKIDILEKGKTISMLLPKEISTKNAQKEIDRMLSEEYNLIN